MQKSGALAVATVFFASPAGVFADETRTARPASFSRLSPAPAAKGFLVHLADFPEQVSRSGPGWGRVLADIARHLPATARYEDAYQRYTRDSDLVTAGHEWTHFLNEYLGNQAGVGVSAYYVLENRYVTLSDPEGLRGTVPPVPSSLKGDLYDLYLVQNAGNARFDPLYLFDEWVAYTNDVTVAVDLLDSGEPLNPFNPRAIQTKTAGNVLEFTLYAFAVGMAVKQHDPAYYASENGRKLREFVVWNAQRALQIYGTALQRAELSSGDPRNVALLRSFRAGADTAAMRAWVKSDLGDDMFSALMRAGGASYSVRADGARTPDSQRGAGRTQVN